MSTITSANSSIVLSVPDVFPNDIVLQGYATDDEFTHDSFQMTERRMGVDGKLSAGYTPNPKKITLAFQADSPSIAAFQAWGAAQEAAVEAFQASLTIALPSIGTQYVCNVGWLADFKKLPDAKKVLEPQSYAIEFQSIDVAPL